MKNKKCVRVKSLFQLEKLCTNRMIDCYIPRGILRVRYQIAFYPSANKSWEIFSGTTGEIKNYHHSELCVIPFFNEEIEAGNLFAEVG